MKYYIKEFGKNKEDVIKWIIKALPSSPISESLTKLLESNQTYSLKYEKYNWEFNYVLESKEKIDVR